MFAVLSTFDPVMAFAMCLIFSVLIAMDFVAWRSHTRVMMAQFQNYPKEDMGFVPFLKKDWFLTLLTAVFSVWGYFLGVALIPFSGAH